MKKERVQTSAIYQKSPVLIKNKLTMDIEDITKVIEEKTGFGKWIAEQEYWSETIT